MKLVLLISLLYAVYAVYPDLEKAEGIEIKTYGTQASKDIRAIGRSYAFQLTKKQKFTTYVDDVYTIFNEEGVDEQTKAQTYSKKYAVHVGVVGAGFILAMFLGIGFCFSPCCMCCCNNSQKQTSTMSMWRMIWGTILIILLAANVAGILILIVSGDQVLNLEDDTSDTIDTLADGFVKYLEDTDKQIETLKTKQLVQFIAILDPLVDDKIRAAIPETVKKIKGTAGLATQVGNVVTALTDLDTKLVEATKNINEVKTDVTDLTGTLTTINNNLKICSDTFTDCNADLQNKCSQKSGVAESKFATSFDPSTLDASKIDDIIAKIGEMKTFGDSPPRTLAQWATYVQAQWDDILTTINGTVFSKTVSARQEYKDKLVEAKDQISGTMKDTVQDILGDMKDDVSKNQEKAKKQITATLKYIKDLLMMKEGDKTDVPDVIAEFGSEPIGKYAIFALFVFVCVLLGLVVLTVLVGLLSTIFGCCKVDDEVSPTERTSGTCGTLLMCTSYCSVVLCAIATFVAAILVTVVMAQEGLCKQYNDNTLMLGMKTLSTTIKNPDIDVTMLDVGKVIADALKLDTTVVMEELLAKCLKNETVFAVFDIKEDTMIMDKFKVTDFKKDAEESIKSFDVAASIGSLDIDLNLMDTKSKDSLKANQNALKTGYDYSGIQTILDNTDTTSIGDLAQLSTDVNGLRTTIGDKYNLAGCKIALDAIIVDKATVDTQKAALKGSLTTMETAADAAVAEVTNFMNALTVIDGIVTPTYISEIVKVEVDKAITAALAQVTIFVDYLFDQFLKTVGNCQPIAAVYYTVFNYTCDNIFVHITLLYCALSLIGISLLFYMCVSRCLARYFIKFGSAHPDDDQGNGDQWTKDHSMTPITIGSGNRVGPYPGHYAQTKL